jgi:thiosulfate/3-mercaptopyruvate sulfurtransferase
LSEFDYPHGDLLASATWLAAHLNDPTVKVLDARSSAGYAAGHIPGAVLLPATAFRSTSGVPDTCTAEEFAATAGALGVRPTDTVVCYDGVTGARAWWAFTRFGHQQVRFLNGTFRHWQDGGHPVSADAAPPQPVNYQMGPTQDHLACSLQFAIDNQGGNDVLFWDVRSEGEFTGADPRSNPPQRAGHLPRAIHLEWTDLVDATTGMYKPAAEMRALLANKGITPEKEVVAY